MKNFKTLILLAVPFTLAVAGLLPAIQTVFGIPGGISTGLLYVAFVLLVPLVYVLASLVTRGLRSHLRQSTYEDFMDKHFFHSREVVVISSGAEQLSQYLEGISPDSQRGRPRVSIYLRERDNAEVFRDRVNRLATALSRLGLDYELNALTWHPMMISAIVVNKQEAIFNFYMFGKMYMSRVHSRYIRATRGRSETDDWLFTIYDRWEQDCRHLYEKVAQ